MAVGGVIAGLAFFVAGILELALESTYPQFPDNHHSFLNIINTLPCHVRVQYLLSEDQNIQSGDILMLKSIACQNHSTYKLKMTTAFQCGFINITNTTISLQLDCLEYQIQTAVIAMQSSNEIQAHIIDRENFKKSLSGAARLRIVYLRHLSAFLNVTISLRNIFGEQDIYYVPDLKSQVIVSAYMELAQGIYQCVVGYENNPSWFEKHMHLASGGVYELIIREDHHGIAFMELYTMSVPNTISILWQLPQYLLISVAEIMFGIAGLEYTFTQAPKGLKTITIAGWYLSVAVGNFLVIFVTQLRIFKSQAYEFFLYSSLIVIDMIIFVEIGSKLKITVD